MDAINERIKTIREACKKTQEEFGKTIGITKSGISDIENGRRRVTEQHIIMLRNWNEYKVNEDWLRTGEGEMFISMDGMDIAYNHFGYMMENSSPQKKAVLSALVEMAYQVPDDNWDYIIKQFNNCLHEAKKQGES